MGFRYRNKNVNLSTANALGVFFNNLKSKLKSTNVQDAIDEVKEITDELNSNLNSKRGKVAISTDNISKQIGKAGLPYTCTEDCLMIVSRLACASTNEVFVRINDLNIISSNSSTVYTGFTMPLNAGDIVNVNNTEYVHDNTRFSFYKAK